MVIMMSEWISVKDKLPNDQQRVLAWFADCANILLWFANNEFDEIMTDCYRNNTKHLTDSVTHWMTLPSPPNTDQKKPTCNTCSHELQEPGYCDYCAMQIKDK